jgi:hypothetical protein
MKLKCPACGAPIAAENINVKALTAVCSECDSVFPFQVGQTSIRRKIKPPEQFTFYEAYDSPLHFSFKWDWRTEPMGALVLLVLPLILFAVILGAGLSGFDLLMLLLLAILPAYIPLTITFNSTHYKIDGDMLKVYTSPLWFPYYGRKTIPLDDISHLSTEHALNSPSIAGPDTFQNVYVHTLGGSRHMIARIVNIEHAQTIAQELQTYIDNSHRTGEALFDPTEADSSDDQLDHYGPETDALSRQRR